MFKELAEDFYEDGNGTFCIIAETVRNPRAVAKKTGLIKVINDDETVVIIPRHIVDKFKQIELEQRLNIFFNILNYNVIDAVIPRFDGNYLIAAEPLDKKEVIESGIFHKIGFGRIAVRFQRFYRSNVAQNEIDRELGELMEKLRDSYKSEFARKFCDYLID